LCGDVRVIVPRGVKIVVRRILLCGDKDVDIDESALTDTSPTVSIFALLLCGDVRVTNY